MKNTYLLLIVPALYGCAALTEAGGYVLSYVGSEEGEQVREAVETIVEATPAAPAAKPLGYLISGLVAVGMYFSGRRKEK